MIPFYNDQNKTEAEKQLEKISAAIQERAMEDAASMVIADGLGSQIAALSQGVQNGNDGIAMLQIADGVLSGLSQNTERLAELSVRSNSAALNSDQKAMLQNEFDATVDSMRQNVEQASFNGKSIFGENMTFSLGAGEIQANVSDVAFGGLDMNDLDSIEAFGKQISDIASEVGSAMNGMQSGVTNAITNMTNLSASRSQLVDTDMADAVTQFQNNQLKLDASTLAQAHQQQMMQQRIASLLF
jgi:flagellin